MKKFVASFSLLVTLLPAHAASQKFSRLERIAASGARVSALAVTLRDGKVIAEVNSDLRLAPASLTKTLLAAAALEKWGSDHSFTTQVYIDGTRKSGTLDGDVIVVGSGDPYLTNEKLWFLATDVARLGVRDVRGDLVLNTSLFGKIEKDANREAGEKFSRNAYNSPLSAVAVNFSVLALVAGAADRGGDPAPLGLEPYPLDTVKVEGHVATLSNGQGKLNLSRNHVRGIDVLNASGQTVVGQAPLRTYRSVSDADQYAGSVLRAFLEHAGVKVRGKIKIENTPLRKSARLLTAVEGFPLDWQIRGLFKVSNNFIGDMLTILLDDRKAGLTFEGGAAQLQKYMQNVLAEQKTKPAAPALVVASGSGLTPENRLSASDFVALYEHMFQNTREFPVFLAALPIPGAEGTVKKRFSEPEERHLQSRVRAKTGTLTEPVDAVALGGYCRLNNGDWAAFATIVNGTSKHPNVGVQNVHDAVDADLASIFPENTRDGNTQ